MKFNKKIIKKIAKQNGVSEEEVLGEIKIAIEYGLSNPDPHVKTKWEHISQNCETLSPENVITYLAREIKEKQ